MANIYTTIQRKVNRDEFDFLRHALFELHEENFSLAVFNNSAWINSKAVTLTLTETSF